MRAPGIHSFVSLKRQEHITCTSEALPRPPYVLPPRRAAVATAARCSGQSFRRRAASSAADMRPMAAGPLRRMKALCQELQNTLGEQGEVPG